MNEHDKKLLDTFWNDEQEKMLDDELAKNKELRELFEKHPERKEAYKLKIVDAGAMHIPTPLDDICCKTCMFKLSPILLGGEMTPRHNWGHCQLLDDKPHEVLYEGAECIFYEKES